MARKLIKMVVQGTMEYSYDAKTGKYVKGADNFTQNDDEIQFKDQKGNFIELSDEMLEKIFSN